MNHHSSGAIRYAIAPYGSAIIAKIQEVMQEFTGRYMDQCRNKKNLWNEHVQAFEDTKRRLAKLVRKAEAIPCVVSPKAYEGRRMR